MTTLFDSRLSCRDYASRLLHVGELLEWAKSNRLHLRTTPPIDKGEFIQVENLLCAIERHASNLTPEQALDIVLNDPVLKNDPALQKYSDDIDPVRCLWLIGANAHKKWRELLTSAIAAHELTLLDFGSKLPIHTAPTTDSNGPAKPNAPGLKQPAQENRVLEMLKSSGYDPLNLPDRQPGKSGAKTVIKRLALLEPALFTAKTFTTAWERLRGDGRIAGGE